MQYYSWTKESRTLKKKKQKKKYIYIHIYIYIYKCVKYDDILERYWKSVSKFQGIKGQYYDSNKFSNNKAIIIFSFKISPIQLKVFVDYTFTLWL